MPCKARIIGIGGGLSCTVENGYSFHGAGAMLGGTNDIGSSVQTPITVPIANVSCSYGLTLGTDQQCYSEYSSAPIPDGPVNCPTCAYRCNFGNIYQDGACVPPGTCLAGFAKSQNGTCYANPTAVPTVTSFNPTTVSAGTTVPFTVTGTNFDVSFLVVSVGTFATNTVSASTSTQGSGFLVIPANAPVGPVTVTVYNHVGSATGLTVNVVGTPSNIGVERYGTFYLDGTNSHGPSASITDFFVPPGGFNSADIAVAGDWAGIGKSSPGWYRPSTGTWYLDYNGNGVWDYNQDVAYQFGGDPSDKPVVGDWVGQNKSCIGVFRYGSTWILDINCNGHWDGVGYGLDNQFAFGGVTAALATSLAGGSAYAHPYQSSAGVTAFFSCWYCWWGINYSRHWISSHLELASKFKCR